MTRRPLLLALLAGCTPDARDLVLDTAADRHFSTGDVYRIPDDDCTGPVAEPGDQGFNDVTVRNDYLETSVVAVLVAPDCSTTLLGAAAPGEAPRFEVEIPAVVGIELDDETRLSTWATWYPGSGGTIVVQP